MIADPITIHVVLETYLRPLLADPRYSDSVTEGAVGIIVERFQGMEVPSPAALIRARDQAEADAHASRLIHSGMKAAAVAERVGVHRCTIYARVKRHRKNNPHPKAA